MGRPRNRPRMGRSDRFSRPLIATLPLMPPSSENCRASIRRAACSAPRLPSRARRAGRPMSDQAEATIAELAETVVAAVHTRQPASQAGPFARRAVRRRRLSRQRRRLLRSGQQLPAGRAANAPRPADHAGARLQVRGRRRRADGTRHQCARPFSGGREMARLPDSEANAGRNGWMYVDPFYGGELLDDTDICRRIAETTGHEAADPSQLAGPGHAPAMADAECSTICKPSSPTRAANATCTPCRNCKICSSKGSWQ